MCTGDELVEGRCRSDDPNDHPWSLLYIGGVRCTLGYSSNLYFHFSSMSRTEKLNINEAENLKLSAM